MSGTSGESNALFNQLKNDISDLLKRINALEAGMSVTKDQIISTQLLSEWKFNLVSTVSNASYVSVEEAAINHDDASWRKVSVPHDWSIEQDFNSSSLATYEGGYLDGGDAWYRTTINVDKEDGKRYILNFDGVYMESTLYVNGEYAHKNYYGYNPFVVDITQFLVNGDNTIAVFVRNEQPSSRWYSGSGIFRPVEFVTLYDNQVRMENIHVTTPKLDTTLTDGETIITFDALNNSLQSISCVFTVELFDPSGSRVASAESTISFDTGEVKNISITVPLENPQLWGIGNGKLYSAQISVQVDKTIQKTHKVFYGYRSIRFDKDTGFYLNGVHTKLKGVCVHHDGGCIGASENRSSIERQIDILMKMGCNAIRLTHNPFGKTYLDVCQEKGILLIEELFDGWTKVKKQKDFGRYFEDHYNEVITNTIHRDWNNPAIIMWSLGNEVTTNLTSGGYTSDELINICTQLCNAVKTLDTTRPTTMGNNAPSGALRELMSIVDVVGINYNSNKQTYQTDRPIYGSETTSALSSRGVYVNSDTDMTYSSYDNKVVSWGNLAAETVNAYLTNNRSCGHFVWTGFDYIGEPTEWNKYPAKSSYFGIVDTCGFPKDIYYMYQSMWTEEPMIHILPHWTHESGNVDVWIYSNCSSVELFLNGQSLGRKTQSDREAKNQYSYTVTYAPGTIVANGYDESGDLVAQDVQYTSGNASMLNLSSDKTSVGIDTDDLVYITCDVVDKNGTIVPNASNKVTFAVTGGEIIGTDNGHGACVEKYQGVERSAFSGKCLCVVRHNGVSGQMVVTATSDGLTTGTAVITKSNTTKLATMPISSFIDATNPPIRDVTEDVPATGISLSAQTLSMTIGDTATLIATIEPSSSTDTVYWTVNPSGVVTVSDGLVTAITAGNATITATAGDFSATCTIEVAELLPVLYKLPNEVTFSSDTDSIIDTGVAMFNDITVKPQYTILYDVTIGENVAPSGSETVVLCHCMEESNPWPGFVLHVAGTTKTFQANMYGSKITVMGNSNGKHIRGAFVLDGGNWYSISNRGNTDSSAISSYKNSVAKTLLIGGYQKSDGTHGRFFDGTLHEFKLYDGAMTEVECQKWVNQ